MVGCWGDFSMFDFPTMINNLAILNTSVGDNGTLQRLTNPFVIHLEILHREFLHRVDETLPYNH